MYNERKESFSFRDIIIQALFVILFIFILIWFFPSKSSIKNDINDAIAGVDITVTEESTRIFNENVNSMKEAAKSYFTLDRLPKNTGDKVVMTLSEMLQKKIILPFVDHEGKQCDLHNSFVEIVKMDDEYIMKINLECGDHKDYVLVHMGCYNYCETDICEKKEDDKKSTTPTVTKPRPTTPKPTPNKPKEPNKPVVQYEYEYKKEIKSSYTNWSNWSSWSTKKVDKTKLRDVETRSVQKSRSTFMGYTKEPVYKKVEKIVGYKNGQCTSYTQVGTGQYKTTYDYYTTTTVTKGHVPNVGSGVTYQYKDNIGAYDRYDLYKIVKVEIMKNGSCKTYKQEPIYGIVEEVDYYKDVPKYSYSTYTVTEYRERTRKVVPAKVEYRWSVNNDNSLIKDGYVKTGKKRTK